MEEGWVMDKRNGRNRDAEGVELIRIRPHDTDMDYERQRVERKRAERARMERRRRKKKQRFQKRVAMVSMLVCTVLLGLGGIHFVKAGEASGIFGTGEVEEIEGESQSQEILGPVPMVPNEVLERETAEHEKPFIVIDPGLKKLTYLSVYIRMRMRRMWMTFKGLRPGITANRKAADVWPNWCIRERWKRQGLWTGGFRTSRN